MSDNTGWWERYYVRYFVGTAFAVPLLLLLGQKQPWIVELVSLQSQKLKEAPWLTAGFIGAAGLAFCYIASAPILLLHGIRAQIPKCDIFYNLLLTFFCLIALYGAAILICPELGHWLHSQYRHIPFLVIIIIQSLFLLYVTWIRNGVNSISEFYLNLATARVPDQQSTTRNPAAVKEYVESYRHLREHGNALMILAMEVVLTMALLTAESPQRLIGIVMLWIMPACTTWFLGTWLERSVDRVLK